MKYKIYLYQNKINNKSYVGLTGTSVELRFKRHYKKARYKCKNKNGNYFQRALIKYSKKDWNLSILEECNTLLEAEKAEIKWISHFKSNQKEFGYNSTEGGRVTIFTDDIKQKISKSVSELWENKEYRENASNKLKRWHKENDNPFKNKKHTEESKSIISDALKQWHKTNENPFRGKKHTKESRMRMSKAAKERCSNPNWCPPAVKNGVSKETRKKQSDAAKKRKRKIICSKKELKKLFNIYYSPKIVSDILKCTPAHINYLIDKFKLNPQYKKDAENKKSKISKEDIINIAKKSSSKREMAKKLNCTSSMIIQYCNKFNIKNEVDKLINPGIFRLKQMSKSEIQKIINELGSVSAAAKKIGCSHHSIINYLKNKNVQ